MKILKKSSIVIFLLLTSLLVVGCGNSSSYSKADDTSTEVKTLVIGEEVEVFQGDEIKPADESTKVEVRHIVDTDSKYVTLLSGSAELIRGNYYVE